MTQNIHIVRGKVALGVIFVVLVLSSEGDAINLRTTSTPTSKIDHRAPIFKNWKKMRLSFIASPESHSKKLRCLADGAQPIKYHWLKDGKAIVRNTKATLSYLRLRKLVPQDSGQYTCVVSNAYGTINHTYTLHVVAKLRSRPTLQRNLPKNTSVALGDNATLSCIVVASDTLSDFRWLKWKQVPTTYPLLNIGIDNKAFTFIDLKYYDTIRSGDRYGVKVTIVNVTEKDLGLYTCLVRNNIGSDHVSAFLNKKIEPKTTKSPEHVDHRAPIFKNWKKMRLSFIASPESHSKTLSCLADGAQPIKYHWLKDGTAINRNMRTNLSYLKLRKLVPQDSGKYTCVVSNAYGTIYHTYTLHVVAKLRSRPTLQRNLPKNTSVALGDNATLSCIVVASDTLPDFMWLKWKQVPTTYPLLNIGIDNKAFTFIDLKYYDTIRSGDRYGVKVTIVNVTEKDLGLYTCLVRNHIGSDHVSAFLNKKIEPKTTKSPKHVDPPTANEGKSISSKYRTSNYLKSSDLDL